MWHWKNVSDTVIAIFRYEWTRWLMAKLFPLTSSAGHTERFYTAGVNRTGRTEAGLGTAAVWWCPLWTPSLWRHILFLSSLFITSACLYVNTSSGLKSPARRTKTARATKRHFYPRTKWMYGTPSTLALKVTRSVIKWKPNCEGFDTLRRFPGVLVLADKRKIEEEEEDEYLRGKGRERLKKKSERRRT